MENKKENIIVEVTIGATQRVSDYMLPAHIPINMILDEMVRQAEQVYSGIVFEDPMLFDGITGKPMAGNMTLAQLGIREGYPLILA